MELLKKINNERQTTIFLILHDLNLAYKYGDEILIMESGKLKLFGDKQDILNTQTIEDIFKVNANIVDNSYINITKI